MLQPLCLFSIPGTATRFTIDLLRAQGYETCRPNEPSEPGMVHHCHIVHGEAQTDTALELSKRLPTIIPLRHPYAAERTWRRRETASMRIGQLAQTYKDIAERFTSAYLLPVDSPRRDEFLRAINTDLGLSLETDWKPAYSERKDEEQQPPSQVVSDLTNQLNGFLSEIYDRPPA